MLQPREPTAGLSPLHVRGQPQHPAVPAWDVPLWQMGTWGTPLLAFPHSYCLAGIPRRFATLLFWMKQHRPLVNCICWFLVYTGRELAQSVLKGVRGKEAASLVFPSSSLFCKPPTEQTCYFQSARTGLRGILKCEQSWG